MIDKYRRTLAHFLCAIVFIHPLIPAAQASFGLPNIYNVTGAESEQQLQDWSQVTDDGGYNILGNLTGWFNNTAQPPQYESVEGPSLLQNPIAWMQGEPDLTNQGQSWYDSATKMGSDVYNSMFSAEEPPSPSSWYESATKMGSNAYNSMFSSEESPSPSSWYDSVTNLGSSAYDSVFSSEAPYSDWYDSVANMGSSAYNSLYDSAATLGSDAYNALPAVASLGSITASAPDLDQLSSVCTEYFDTLASYGQGAASTALELAVNDPLTVAAIAGALAIASRYYKDIISTVSKGLSTIKSWIMRNVYGATEETVSEISKMFSLLSLTRIKAGFQPLPESITANISHWQSHKLSIETYKDHLNQAISTNQIDALDAMISVWHDLIDPKDLVNTSQGFVEMKVEDSVGIARAIVRPSVPVSVVETMLTSNLTSNREAILTAILTERNNFGVLYQAKLNLLLVQYKLPIPLPPLQWQKEDNVREGFLRFFESLLPALTDSRNLPTVQQLFGSIKPAGNPSTVELELMDLFLEEGQCMAKQSLNSQTCNGVKRLFKTLIGNSDLSTAQVPRLNSLQFSNNFGTLFTSLKDSFAMLAAALVQFKPHIDSLSCGWRDGTCQFFKKAAQEAPSVYQDPCGAEGDALRLIENMPSYNSKYDELDNAHRHSFVQAMIQLLTGVHPDYLPSWLSYKQSFADAFNGTLNRYCSRKNLKQLATMNVL